jgi:O-acetyl-ADP-ribose deacetylase
MPLIEFIQGDITREAVDAVVNAANSSLLGGGGVDGAIHRRGGPAILAACQDLRKARYPQGLPTGHAVATLAGNLRARWVIHTVGPVYARSPNPARELAACHLASLAAADELGAATVSFPAISTGVYGYPMYEAAEVAVRAVMSAKTKVELVRFVLFDAEAHDVFLTAWERRHE